MTSRRRALFLTQTHNVWGGMEQWLHNFTAWLQKETSWDVRVGLVRGAKFNDPTRYLAAHPHMRPVTLDVRAGTESSRISALLRAIDDVQPDLVVPIASGTVFSAMAIRKRARLIVPVRSQHPDLLVNISDYFGIVDGVVVVNRLMQRWFDERFHERIHYVRHGCRTSASPVPSRTSTTGEGACRTRVGFIGRLEPAIKRALDLVPFVRALQSNAEVHVFGDGPSEGELRAALGDRVNFHGYTPQDRLYADAYPNLDVVLLFSTEEGTPNVICEAMQHGVVPVTSRYRGQALEGFVIDGVTGFTFPVGDAAAAAAHVDALANDRALLAKLSRAAYEQVRGDTAERMHRDWLSIFETTLALPMKSGGETGALGCPTPAQAGAPVPPRQTEPVPRPDIAPAGRLDRIVGSAIADRLRVAFHRGAPHDDGWGEWPGTVPVSRERAEQVVRELEEIDRLY